HQKLSSARSKRDAVVSQNVDLEQKISKFRDVQAAQAEVASIKAQMAGLLQNDVGWPKVLDDLAHTLPAGVTLSGFQGTVTTPVAAPPAPVAPTPPEGSSTPTSAPTGAPTTPAVAAPIGLNGQLQMSGTAPSPDAVAAWIDTVKKDKAVSSVWVSTIQR